jgi:hypothetical protein
MPSFRIPREGALEFWDGQPATVKLNGKVRELTYEPTFPR